MAATTTEILPTDQLQPPELVWAGRAVRPAERLICPLRKGELKHEEAADIDESCRVSRILICCAEGQALSLDAEDAREVD